MVQSALANRTSNFIPVLMEREPSGTFDVGFLKVVPMTVTFPDERCHCENHARRRGKAEDAHSFNQLLFTTAAARSTSHVLL